VSELRVGLIGSTCNRCHRILTGSKPLKIVPVTMFIAFTIAAALAPSFLWSDLFKDAHAHNQPPRHLAGAVGFATMGDGAALGS
jgi:hypothetical protein